MPYPLIPDVFPKLDAERITLRALCEADLPAWFARLSDDEAVALASDPPATSIAEAHAALHHHLQAFLAKEAIRWAIVPHGRAGSVGTIGLGSFDATTRSAALGGAVGRADWGRGIATRAAVRVVRYAFDDLELDIVWAVVLPENARVQRVLVKAGFVPGCPVADIDRRIGMRTDTQSFHVRRT